jgi:uncharacterized protein
VMTTVLFDRDDLALAGNLFTPPGFDEGEQYEAVIVQGSFTSVKEQMPRTYAERFAAQGFVALAFDYAHYGESAGEPRQLESPAEKLSDLLAAVAYLHELPFIRAVGMVGICTSAGNGVTLAASDSHLGAFATVAAFLPSPALNASMFGEERLAQRIEQSADARRRYDEAGEVELIPTYSETDPSAVNYRPTEGAYDYYLNKTRGNVPQYTNASAVMGLAEFLVFDPVSQASSITVPTMVVHSDGSAFPDEAKRLYEAVEGEKELVWGDGNHFDYYDSPAQVDFAVENVSRFFRLHLSA